MAWRRVFLLAWKNMTHDARRLMVAMAGVAFAVVLMGMELGFFYALLDSMVELIHRLDADLIIVSRSKNTLFTPASFNSRVIASARAFKEVKDVSPLYIESRLSLLKVPETRPTGDQPVDPTSATSRGQKATALKIRVLAFNPEDRVFTIDEVNRQAEALKAPDTALYDELSRTAFGPIGVDTVSTLARRPIRIVGTFRLGTDLVNGGSLIMSDQNFLRFFPDRRVQDPSLRRVEVGLVRLAPGADRETMRARLDQELAPMGVDVFTKDAFMARERAFWKNRTPVGAIFLLGVALGMVVGLVICYQILSSDIADHMAEYATLKAMGRGNAFMVGIVVLEAILLACLGFLPGVAICKVLSMGLARSTGMFMDLSPGRALLILELTVIMCLGSALFAVRKLLSADPAELF